MSDTPPTDAALRLDVDAVRLLEALHRGCTVRLDEEEGLRWHVEPRIVIPMRLHGDDEITMVDLDSPEMFEGVQAGPRRHIDDWSLDQPHLRLDAGILLIRTALAIRKGILLLPTPLGRAIAATRIGPGVDIAGRPVPANPSITPPMVAISNEPIEMAAFMAITAEQRITVLPGPQHRTAVLRFEAVGRRLEASLERRDVDRAFATLDQAIEHRTRCLVQLSESTRLLKGGRIDRIEIETLQDFDRAIVRLSGPDMMAFVEAVRRALDDDVTTVMQPVAVAYARFDAVLDRQPTKPSN